MGTLNEVVCTFMIISGWILQRMGKFLDESCREDQNTHFVFDNCFFRKSCRLWYDVEKYGRPRRAADDNIMRRMRFACWIRGYRLTLRLCNTHSFSTSTFVSWTRLSVTWYVRYLSCWLCRVQRMSQVCIEFHRRCGCVYRILKKIQIDRAWWKWGSVYLEGVFSCVMRSCIIQGGQVKGCELGGRCSSEERSDNCVTKLSRQCEGDIM